MSTKLDDLFYELTFAHQEGRCGMCRLTPEEIGAPLEIDCVYATGEPRGLLCPKCHETIVFFKDDDAMMERARIFLRDHYRAADGQFYRKESAVGI